MANSDHFEFRELRAIVLSFTLFLRKPLKIGIDKDIGDKVGDRLSLTIEI